MELNPWFITGLIEGEGCFCISFTKKKRFKIGIETRPSFSISLNRRDLALIKQIHLFFGCGAVRYSRGDRTYKYEVRSIGDLTDTIIPHFKKFPLVGDKKQDFDKFESICRQIKSNLHLSRRFLPEIIRLAYQMNSSGRRKYDIRYLLRIFDE